jgi:hypothetical protein
MLLLALDDFMFAMGCGKSRVGDQGMLKKHSDQHCLY